MNAYAHTVESPIGPLTVVVNEDGDKLSKQTFAPAVDRGNDAHPQRVGVRARIGFIESGDVGEDDEGLGFDQPRHQAGERVGVG